MKSITMIAAVAVLAGFAVAISGLLNARPDVPMQPQAIDIKTGKVLYARNCASCHGIRLEGQKDWRTQTADGRFPAPPHDENGHTWHHGDGLLFAYTKFGGKAALAARGVKNVKSGMPGFGKVLSDQEIWDILAFIKSTWSDRARAMQDASTKAEHTLNNF